jgi:beta-N-acetylhexosaminidase
MGAAGSAAEAGAEGARTAAYLRGLGIDVDLAPVLDTPASSSSFLGSRAFSGDPRLNAQLGTAFLRGLQRAGVAATAKHFPGLGTAPANTDISNVVLTTPVRVLDARLLPFERAVGAGVDLVMVSNAAYRAYDPTGAPADLSRPIVTGLLRHSLGFRGVVITDAMEAPGPSSRAGAAVAALAAGDDILLYTKEIDSANAFAQVVAAATSGALPAGVLEESAARIEALKRRLAHA